MHWAGPASCSNTAGLGAFVWAPGRIDPSAASAPRLRVPPWEETAAGTRRLSSGWGRAGVKRLTWGLWEGALACFQPPSSFADAAAQLVVDGCAE